MMILVTRIFSGNLGRVEHSGQNEYELFIRVDTCNQKYRLWFFFSVANCHKDQTVIFHIVNFSKGLISSSKFLVFR